MSCDCEKSCTEALIEHYKSQGFTGVKANIGGYSMTLRNNTMYMVSVSNAEIIHDHPKTGKPKKVKTYVQHLSLIHI